METKENKGVTLIALAVTIIVMLILAGVTISALTGNSGITTKAKQAKMLSEAKTEEEAIRLVVTYTNMQKNIGEENIIYLGEPLHDKDLVSGNQWKVILDTDKQEKYGTGWYFIEKDTEIEKYGKTKNEWVVNYEEGQINRVGERLGVDEIGWPWKAPNCIEGARLSAQRLGAIRAPRTTVADRIHLLPPVRKKRGRFSRNSRASIIRGIVGKGNPQSSVRFALAPNKRQRRRARLTRRTRLPYTEAKRRAEARSEEGMGDFSDRVFEVVRRIPRGKVATYGQVGRLIGAPRSARYVGYALRANPEPGAEVNSIPCHRVVFKDGGLCKGFAFGGPEVQREMLEAEGVAFADDAHVDMGVCLWDGRMDDADDPTLPMAPPEDFDWERELGA